MPRRLFCAKVTSRVINLRRLIPSMHAALLHLVTSAKEVLFSLALVCSSVSRISQKPLNRFSFCTTSHQVRRARLFSSLVRLHGTDYQKTFARNPTSLTFENFLKLTILIPRVTFNNCILSFYL